MRTRTERNKEKKRKKWAKVIGIIVLIILLLILIAGGLVYWYIHNKLGKMNKVTINEDDLDINSAVEEKLSGYRNIAIFAIDSREDDYGKGNRSDGIIIATINNSTKEVRLTSVYRDTYAQIEGHGLDKITHAYSYGEAPLAISTLNTNLDLNIKEFATVNFDSVIDIVNALDGVEINIESESELKYVNDYISATSTSSGVSSPKLTRTGRQTLNGVQAVAYARVRYTAGGDYKRTERMRNVIMATAEKLKTRSVSEINKFLDVALPKIYTNISTNEIISMVPNALNYKITGSIGWPYNVKGITIDRWYGVPVTLESNVKKLHQEIFGEADYEPTATVKEISDKIIKKTGYQ